MSEAVRLVIWDLDETFWHGTLTEGGIELRADTLAMVEILARRGIISTICSKNDLEAVRLELEQAGVWNYFVMPSVDWTTKGPRVAGLVADFQLRPETILFIDDNPNNLAEARAIVPRLQTEDQHFIETLLDDPRFQGKDDSNFSRLEQYRLLATKKSDERGAGGNNEAFLRSCDVRVRFEYDIEDHLDRAVELINRTNQLNFTRRRLSEDTAVAREQLREMVNDFSRQAALVHVVDKYGDYGFVGFYLTQTQRTKLVPGAANSHLVHFCFSCRTLGMLVEKWVYDRLGRPELRENFPTLTDLSLEVPVDWIREVQAIETGEPLPKVAPQITLIGGCEANAIGVYLSARCDRLEVLGNYAIGGRFVRVNTAASILGMLKLDPEALSEAAAAAALPIDSVARDFYANAPDGSVFVFNFSLDTNHERMRHKKHRDWFVIMEPREMPGRQIAELTAEDLADHFTQIAHYSEEQRADLRAVGPYVIENFEMVSLSYDNAIESTRELIERAPKGSRVILATDHKRMRLRDGALIDLDNLAGLAKRYEALAEEYPFVSTASFDEVIESADEIQPGGNHYDREVYLRFANLLADRAEETSPRATDPTAGLKREDGRIDYCFGTGGPWPILEVGWDIPENVGRWMTGDISELVLDLNSFDDERARYVAELDLWPMMVPEVIDQQRLIICLGEQRVLQTSIERRRTIRFQLGTREDIWASAGRLFFIHPDAVAPVAVGRGSDLRRLSLMANTLRIHRLAADGAMDV